MSVSITTLRRLGRDEGGAVALVFALVAIPLFLITGLAVDFGRIYHVNSKIGASIDAAALAAAKSLRIDNMSDAEVKVLAKTYFDQNMAHTTGNYASIRDFDVVINRDQGSVEIKVDAQVHTVIWGIADRTVVDLPKSTVAIFAAKDIEVGLQLDVTGSMRGQKLADLKTATKDLVDILIPDEPTGQKVRVGYAPFSAGVNAGTYARSVNGGRASNGCTYERLASGAEFTDMAPVGTSALKIKADLTGSVQDCPAATVLPMTDSKTLLKSTVDSYRDGGTTAGQLGTAWSWYLLSPSWSGIWPSASQPAPYRDGKTIKVAILMTDGIYNTVGGINVGDTNPVPSQKAREMCDGMKAEGIVVYTVGFQLPTNSTLPRDTLTDCASEPGNFFPAENGTQLRAAFRSIAEQITSLRLSK